MGRLVSTALKILLDEARTDVNVELYQWRITNRLKAVDLAGLDDKDVSSAALEGLAAHGPHPPAFTDELDLVIRMLLGNALTQPPASVPPRLRLGKERYGTQGIVPFPGM